MLYTILRQTTACLLFVTSWSSGQNGTAITTNHEYGSTFTSLKASSCKEVSIKNDPNGLQYLVCAGVAGYHLQISPVDSGRLSINIETPAKRIFPLDYQTFVTRSMDHVDEKAEWRVRRENGKSIPVALIVRVLVHGDSDEKITGAFWAIAKITHSKACVTDRIREGDKPVAVMRALADSAARRPCAEPLPMADTGTY